MGHSTLMRHKLLLIDGLCQVFPFAGLRYACSDCKPMPGKHLRRLALFE